ncbi:MAG TPA: hypothetical protein VEA36_00215 [Candidatus Paceibacterota bacterium]|nr:hypothetical protein [Candidatus Paceibacterota bacterium]
MKKNTWLWIIGISALLALIWFASASTREGTATKRTNREIAMSCMTHESDTFHIHPTLSIMVNGEPIVVPADIGITPGCMRAIHTHTPDGIIHIESNEPRDFTLADFFANWEKPFSATQILEHVADDTHRIRMTVNGAEVDTFENTILRDKDQIVIYYEPVTP